MNLSQNNFSKSACMFKQRGSIAVPGIIYSYGSHKDLFDIVIIDGLKYYQKNMKGYFKDIRVGTKRMVEPIHREIERHFNI